MKLEELTQDKLDEILASIEAANESNKGLRADLAKAKAKAKGADIDPEAHAALQTQVEELTTKLSSTEKQLKTENEKLTKAIQSKDGALTKYLIEAQLSDSLSKVGVKPEFMDASKALLRMQATIKEANGEYQALIGDKPVSDFVKEWSASDQGKHFVAAAASSGGGAQGGAGTKAAAKTITRSAFDQMAPDSKASFIKEGGVLTE